MALNKILRQIPELDLEELETLSEVVRSFILVKEAQKAKISRLDMSLDELIKQGKASPREEEYPGDSLPGNTTKEELDEELDQIQKSRLC